MTHLYSFTLSAIFFNDSADFSSAAYFMGASSAATMRFVLLPDDAGHARAGVTQVSLPIHENR